jgi:hypothetical protein
LLHSERLSREELRMRRMILSVSFLAGIMMVAKPAFSADLAKLLNNPPEHDSFTVIHVADLAKLLANPDARVHIFDANPPEVRVSEGLIPGARPLTSSDHYDIAGELPRDKHAKLVFYCHNLH